MECWEAIFPEVDWRETWGNLVPCFATSEVPGESVAIVGAKTLGVRPNMTRWANLYPTIALDEWGANDDSNLSNLIEVFKYDGGISYATIDGGRWLGGDNWTLESLGKLMPGKRSAKIYNKLMRAALGPLLNKADADKLLNIALGHTEALESVEQGLMAYMVEILDDFRLATTALETMRARAGIEWIGERHARS
ncbi:hypothetical protein GCM10027296_12290 [Chitinimonas naiadis]